MTEVTIRLLQTLCKFIVMAQLHKVMMYTDKNPEKGILKMGHFQGFFSQNEHFFSNRRILSIFFSEFLSDGDGMFLDSVYTLGFCPHRGVFQYCPCVGGVSPMCVLLLDTCIPYFAMKYII